MHSLNVVCVELTKALDKLDQVSSENGDDGLVDAKNHCSSNSLWVTRYVDYTSKYGLGFLLNDGR